MSFFSKELNNNALKIILILAILHDQRIFKDLKILSNSHVFNQNRRRRKLKKRFLLMLKFGFSIQIKKTSVRYIKRY